ncbi:MAG: CBS domain-containing protein [Sphingomonadaceae bacterium]|nr:CBS domain-containing protein [Sphingomonadaceae bacterium]
MSIRSLLSNRSVVSVAPQTSVREIVALLDRHRIGAVLVLDSESIVGIVSERDIVGELAQQGAGVLDATAGAVMTSPVVTVDPDASIPAAMATMTNRRIRHLPVVAGGALVGLVSIGDLVKRRIEEAEGEASALKDYISAA